jgi:hypothetical protein
MALVAARKALIPFGGVGMTTLIPTIFPTNISFDRPSAANLMLEYTLSSYGI